MNKYRKQIKEEASTFFEEITSSFSSDREKHGGASDVPNIARWLDENGLLSENVEKKAEKWSKKDLLWINENSRNNTKIKPVLCKTPRII
jgi:hypothetical protein